MKPEKLPSGNWRIRVYLGEVNGKKKWKSVTGATKTEVMRKAVLYMPVENGQLSVMDAAKGYIDLKEPVVSPATTAGYKKILKNHLEGSQLAVLRLDKVTTVSVQKWVSDLAKELSPKSVRNCYGFLSAVLAMYVPDLRLHVRLPQRKPQTLYTPTTEDINAVLAVADPELKKAILLGATGMMRRGEICALTTEDVDYENNRITIRKSLVQDADRNYVTKQPKTDSSYRTIDINPEVIALLPKEGPIVNLRPDAITMRMNRAITKAGVAHFRFHDLRHYAASIAVSSAIGAGSMTVQNRGGWNSDHVMKRTYTHSLSDQAQKDTQNILSYFSKNLDF